MTIRPASYAYAMHVYFSADLDSYGHFGANPGQSAKEWKASADALMVEYLEARGYRVIVDDYEASRTRVMLAGEDVTGDWLPEMWDHACIAGSVSGAAQ